MCSSGLGLKDIWLSSPAIMTVLFACSILMIATAIERWWCYSRDGNLEQRLWTTIKRFMVAKDLKSAGVQVKYGHSRIAIALREVFQMMIEKPHGWEENAQDIWHLRRDESTEQLRRRLVVFGTLSFVTPLIGLMGSVLGIHHAFHDIALTGNGGANVVASGISEALLSTLVGVVVAVPALVFYNGFSSALASRVSQWDRIGQELFMIVESWKRPSEKESSAK
jgi:biopolymer transport protein ExbB